MTWVLGANTQFGSILMAADIRITKEGREYDCLRKIYPLGYNIIGSFSGSVRIGLDTLALLTGQFAQSPPGSKWEPEALALTWLPRVIRDRFRRHAPEYRKLGASFLIGAVSPNRNRNELIPDARLYAFRSHTGFQVEEVAPGDAASIGNGRLLEEPVREIVRSSEFQTHWNAGPRMHAFVVAAHLRERVLSQPTPGVAPQFMMGWAVRGDQGIEPWTTLGAESKLAPGSKVKLASSLNELEEIVGAGASNAVG
jgi:hypothetical protein